MSAGIERDVKVKATEKLITEDVLKKKKDSIAKAKEEKYKNKIEQLQRQTETIIYNQNIETLNSSFYTMYANYLFEYEAKKQQFDIEFKNKQQESGYDLNASQSTSKDVLDDYEKTLNGYVVERDSKIEKLYYLYDDIIQQCLNYEIKYIDSPKKTIEEKNIEFRKSAQARAEKLCKQMIANQYRLRDQYLAQLSSQNLLLQQFNLANLKLADIPKTIEDVVQQIKSLLDMAVGRTDIDTDGMEDIDIQKMLKNSITSLLQPFLAAFNPMQAITPKIPILSAIPTIMQMLTTENGSTGLSEEDLKNMGKVEIPAKLKDAKNDIMNNIRIVLATLPMFFINILFQMVDVIYSKLKMITKVIGLGSMFPLNLIDSASSALSKGTSLMTGLPGMIDDLFDSTIKRYKLQQMLLSRPALPSVISSMSLTPDMQGGSPDVKLDYGDVNRQILSTRLSSIGFRNDKELSSMSFSDLYTEYDLNKILTNYKLIKNGTNTVLNYYSIQNGTTDTLNIEQVMGNKPMPDPENYQTYLNDLINDSKSHLSDSLNYMKYTTTEDLIGSTNYCRFKDFIDEKNKNVIIESDIAANGKFRLNIPEFREGTWF